MKKIIFALAAGALALGCASCSENWDDNPVLLTHSGTPTVDFLNIPSMQNQEIMLTEANKNGNFHFTCSQPDYGYAAVATYRVQCSLTEDFANLQEIDQDFYNCAQINPMNSMVASALQYLSGVKTEKDLPLPYQKLYFRLRAFVAQSEANTTYYSNPVYISGVSSDYLAIWVSDQPVNIYLRGGLPLADDWSAIADYQLVTGPEENTWVLNNVTIPAGTEFKLADAQWGAINLGCDDDGTVTPGEPFKLYDNGGNLKVKDEFTGKVVLSKEKGVYYVTLDPAH